ncbi:hypothetical protein ACXET9_08935 [Brachybacterium sp. DNPG3]
MSSKLSSDLSVLETETFEIVDSAEVMLDAGIAWSSCSTSSCCGCSSSSCSSTSCSSTSSSSTTSCSHIG